MKNIHSLDTKLHHVECRRNISRLIGKIFGSFFFGLILLTANVNTRGQSLEDFNPNVGLEPNGSAVTSIAIQPDGKIIIGGSFTNIGGVARPRIARLNPDGSLDATFVSSVSSSLIYDIALQADGKILIAGTPFSPQQPGIGRLNTDGTFDTTFNAGLNSSTNSGIPYSFDHDMQAVTLQRDGKILVGGYFNFIISGQQYYGLARLNADGTIDPSFSPLNTTGATAITLQPDGKILIGGNFRTVTGQAREGLARLNGNGSLDTTFVSPLTAPVNSSNFVLSIALQPDGKILIGGNFATGGTTVPYNHLIRLNANGALDNTFTQTTDGYNNYLVRSIAIQPDGKILIGGSFVFPDVQQLRIGFMRLNSNGATDTTFNPNSNNYVNDIVIQPDGKILVGGSFTNIGGQPRNCLARFLADSPISRRPNFDFDGDGKADISVFRPSNGTWYLNQSSGGFRALAFGVSTDKLVSADYDGDGKTDIAVYRNGIWYIQRSQLGFIGIQFGDGNDIPVPADYDGDGKADVAVFRPSNGTWYLQRSQLGFSGVQFGQIGDKPAAADYDGDGKADVAVFRPSNGVWYILRSQLGFTGIAFGDANDKLVPADYDGDGKADVAVFRPSNGVWYLLRSTNGFTSIAFGFGTDLPTAADYDGDGKADIAVFRQGIWYLNRSTQGFTGIAFGASDDKPIPNVFVP